jgi:Uncharacterized lipoprotein
MKYGYRVAAILLTASLGAYAASRLENVPLVWKPTSSLDIGAIDLSEVSKYKVDVAPFKDVRKQPELIAENREDATPKPVTTKDDVAVFVTTQVRQLFDRAGLSTVDSGGDVSVSGEVRQFFVEETNTYKGDVVLHMVVHSRTGATLWEGNTSGTASRFGRSYKLENYHETLSDSLIDAVSNLLKNQDFMQALAKHAQKH